MVFVTHLQSGSYRLKYLPFLLLACELGDSPISSFILCCRLHDLGGEKYCRSIIGELMSLEFIRLEAKQRKDGREKCVRLTGKGRHVLLDYFELAKKRQFE